MTGVYGEGLGDGYGYHGEEDEENDDDVVYSQVGSVGSGFSRMLQQR